MKPKESVLEKRTVSGRQAKTPQKKGGGRGRRGEGEEEEEKKERGEEEEGYLEILEGSMTTV